MQNSFKIKIIVTLFIVTLTSFAFIWKIYQKSLHDEMTQKIISHADRLTGSNAPFLGSPNPRLNMIVFFDPSCESCKSFHTTVKKISRDFPQELKIILKYADFHEHSFYAIKILEASRKQNQFENTLDLLFKYQVEWGGHDFPNPDHIWKHLENSSLNMSQLQKDMALINDSHLKQKMTSDLSFFNIKKTPTVFLHHEIISNLSYQSLKDRILFYLHRDDSVL